MKETIGKPKHRRKGSIKIDVKEVGFDVVSKNQHDLDRFQRRNFFITLINLHNNRGRN
jgi:hypothetical protein